MSLDSHWMWFAALALIVLGMAGTVLPLLPGAALVFAGMLLAAWCDDFQRVGWITLSVLGALTLLAYASELVAGLYGARRAGASRLALAGAAAGTVVGLMMGIVGLVVMPFLGAVLGEWLAGAPPSSAVRVGAGTWLGLLLGTLAKVALVFTMLALFVASYLFNA